MTQTCFVYDQINKKEILISLLRFKRAHTENQINTIIKAVKRTNVLVIDSIGILRSLFLLISQTVEKWISFQNCGSYNLFAQLDVKHD